ncbi:MAG: hypothetical protein AAFX81_09470 [Pseudomonadota bacterium]
MRTSLVVIVGVALALGLASSPGWARSALLAQDDLELVVGDAAKARIAELYTRFDPDFDAQRAARRERFDELGRVLFEREITGDGLDCSRAIFTEAKWLVSYTAWWERIDAKLDQLERSFAIDDQSYARRPSTDGMFGWCASEEFIQVEATLEQYFLLADANQQPAVKRKPLDWAQSPEALVAYLQSLLIADVARTGEDTRSRVGGLVSMMAATASRDHVVRLIRETSAMPADDRPRSGLVIDAIRSFIDAWQDPETGYWGAWYEGDDGVFKTTDLSITYHIVHARRGHVERWPELIRTTLALRDQAYPFGWESAGRWTNHNNYDLARLFRYGWPDMTEAQRAEVVETLQTMLDWSFEETLAPNHAGFVLVPELSSSVGAEFYFGVSFLDAVGYFADPPWAPGLERPAPVGEVCEALIAHAATLPFDVYAEGAKKKLARGCAWHR